GVATLVIARTDSEAAKLLTSDIDERDQPFVDYYAGRTVEVFYQVRNGIEPCISRAAEMAAFLLRSELVLEVNARGTRLDIGLNDFE
ncbi:hypothetical protein AB9E13_34285, partial [Rhizobium leguminosarum]